MDARALLAKKKLERKKAAAAKPKINSLFAEYDSLGKLKCKICMINIKHESLWNSHVSSRQHKLAIQRIKDEKKKLKVSIHSTVSHNTSSSTSLSKPVQKKTTSSLPKQNNILLSGYGSDSDSNSEDNSNEVEDEPNRKRIKVTEQEANLPPGFFDKPKENGESEDEKENEDAAVPSGLPAGFFDNNPDTTMKEDSESENHSGEEEANQNVASLPKGFFDHPNHDTPMEINEPEEEKPSSNLPSNFFDQKLKPKQMLDKEKAAEDEKLKNEMELFEKEIQQESLNVDIIEEQEEDDFYDRRDKEIELEQEHYLSKMEQLKQRKQQMQENKIKNQMNITKTATATTKKESVKMEEDPDSDSGSDSDLENELYNWRSRGL